MKKQLLALICTVLVFPNIASANELSEDVKTDYDNYLASLWDHFHRNPELSTVEVKTAARMAQERAGALAVAPRGAAQLAHAERRTEEQRAGSQEAGPVESMEVGTDTRTTCCSSCRDHLNARS